MFPSATELAHGVGAGESLVARSHACNYPAGVRGLPVVTESSLSAAESRDARRVDRIVDGHHHGENTLFRVLEDRLAGVAPEVLLAQSLCEVCAVPESMTREAMAVLDPRPEVVTLGPRTVEEVFDAIRMLGRALERRRGAEELVRELRERVGRVEERVPDPDPGGGPRVVCLEWTDAVRCHGLWVADILDRLGAVDGFGEPGGHGHVIAWEDVVAFDPEVLVVSPCGRSIPEIRRDMAYLTGREGWGSLSAVEGDRVYLVDGELSSRHGPRVVRALEVTAAVLYPEVYGDLEYSDREAVRYRSGAE